MKYNFNDFITHVDNKEDLPFLKSVLFDVNMRLYKSSTPYRNIVTLICDYIKFMCQAEMEGYKKPHGMSGANVGIPFNIIGYLTNRNKENERCVIMINPKIVSYSEDKIISKSNCGSIRLQEPIDVVRSTEIKAKWYGLDGELRKGTFRREGGSLTIQHEVDHNNGILITDRVHTKNIVTTNLLN